MLRGVAPHAGVGMATDMSTLTLAYLSVFGFWRLSHLVPPPPPPMPVSLSPHSHLEPIFTTTTSNFLNVGLSHVMSSRSTYGRFPAFSTSLASFQLLGRRRASPSHFLYFHVPFVSYIIAACSPALSSSISLRRIACDATTSSEADGCVSSPWPSTTSSTAEVPNLLAFEESAPTLLSWLDFDLPVNRDHGEV